MREAIGKPYQLRTEDLQRDLYLLLCVFHGSGPLASLANNAYHPNVQEMIREYQDKEISRRLVNIAVNIRILDERFDRNFPGIRGKLRSFVGTWVADTSKGTIQDLELREACNKIIHADQMQLHPDNSLPSKHKGLSRKITLFGSHHCTKWKVDLDLDQFSREAYYAAATAFNST